MAREDPSADVEPGPPPAADEELIAIVRQVVAELHPGSSRGEHATLDSSLDRDLALDSLGRVELVGRVERAFGVALPESLVAAAETPRDLLAALAGASVAVPRARALPAAEPTVAEAAPDRSATLHEVLDWHVRHHPERRHITFLTGDGEAEDLSYGELFRRAKRVAAGLQELGVEPGGKVGLMLPSGLDYFAAFYGAQLAGAVPVPLYPPARLSQVEDHLRRQAAILDVAEVEVLVTFDQVRPLARLLRAQVPGVRRVVTVAGISRAGVEPLRPVARETDVAFLQFTSGSTAAPKGVVLTHANLLANLRAIGQEVEFGPDDVVVSWLPLYHDMGLIGAWMGSLYFGTPLVLMSPLTFLARPARWLEAIDRYRGTLSAAPNFAYELCLKRIEDEEIEGLDLSSWRASLNGAEPVSPSTVERFTERFAPYGYRPGTMMPVYGLAENSLALAFSPVGRGPVIDRVDRGELGRTGRALPAAADDPDALRFVGSGFAIPGHEIRIVDSTGAEVEERREGSLQFSGPSATRGYYRNPEATRRLLHGDWLDSGDRAYIAGGEVFITGRSKDMIIRAGRNIYPQELEEAVGALDGVRKGCVAVFGSEDPGTGTERLIVLAETREKDEAERERLSERIQQAAIDLVGMPADDVALVPPQTVPKTSSGKIRRAAGRELYEGGKGAGRGPVWWQMARLAWSGARPQAARSARAVRELAYAGRFWAAVGLAAVPIGLGLLVVPRLARRRRAAQRAARGVARLTATPIEVSGLEHLEGDGPWIVAANHASYIDGFALTAGLPVGGAFLAKREFEDSPLARLLLARLGTLFVERFDPGRGVEDVERAVAVVERGESLLLFPEGTFHRAPGLRPFRMGAFAVAVRTGVPVVPVAIRGTRSVLRGDGWFPRRGAVEVIVRPPIPPDGDGLAAAARLRDAVRAEILAHCGEPDLQPAA